MATTTPNYGLTKPAATDFYDVSVQNGNMDKIDAAIAAKAPAGYAIYSGYFSTEDKLNSNIANAYAGIADNKIGFAEMDSTSNAQTLKSGKWFFTIYRHSADAGFLIAESPNASGTRKFQRTLSSGSWGAWVDISPSAFAPAGYGLGTDYTPGIADCNAATGNGWYRTSKDTANAPLARPNWMRVDAFDSKYVHQVWFDDQYGGYYVERYCINGVWQPWEHNNPPMVLGVEYRTTERWKGSPVYAQCVDCGAWADQKNIDVSVTACNRVIRYEGVAGDYTLPFIYMKDLNGKYTAYCRVSRTTSTNINIKLCGGLDGSAATYSTYVTVYYVKS